MLGSSFDAEVLFFYIGNQLVSFWYEELRKEGDCKVILQSDSVERSLIWPEVD